jgi:hypothetical protein
MFGNYIWYVLSILLVGALVVVIDSLFSFLAIDFVLTQLYIRLFILPVLIV